jgi:hypothetical protein
MTNRRTAIVEGKSITTIIKMSQQNGIQQNNRWYNSLNQNDTSEQLSPE